MSIDTMAKDQLVGLVVRLKSGSPDMTVIGMDPRSDQLACAWFVEGEFRHATVRLICLDIADDRSKLS